MLCYFTPQIWLSDHGVILTAEVEGCGDPTLGVGEVDTLGVGEVHLGGVGGLGDAAGDLTGGVLGVTSMVGAAGA